MELNLVAAQRKRRAILVLGLQQILHPHVGLSDPVTDAHGVIANLDVENSDRVGRENDLHLVKLHGGVFVDGEEDTLVVPRPGTVDEGTELRNPTRALEVPKVVRLPGERKREPFPARNPNEKNGDIFGQNSHFWFPRCMVFIPPSTKAL